MLKVIPLFEFVNKNYDLRIIIRLGRIPFVSIRCLVYILVIFSVIYQYYLILVLFIRRYHVQLTTKLFVQHMWLVILARFNPYRNLDSFYFIRWHKLARNAGVRKPPSIVTATTKYRILKMGSHNGCNTQINSSFLTLTCCQPIPENLWTLI
jgi:hypothetical protein